MENGASSEPLTARPDIWLCASQVFDGFDLLPDHAIHIQNGVVAAILPQAHMPKSAQKQVFDGTLSPGFFDIQINGGGGVLFNANPTKAGLEIISKAHRAAGTTHWLPTVITDSPDVMTRASDSIVENIGKFGITGIHIEGPHISIERKGTHQSKWIRPFDAHTLAQITKLRSHDIPVLLTVAPEAMQTGEVVKLTAMGVVVSIGHSNADAAQTQQIIDEGAQLFTHLFNAMSPMESRAMNVVGTAINSNCYCSIIVDGLHVDFGAIGLATRARPVDDRMILVSDAMPTVGGADEFELYGKMIKLKDGKLINSDGALAGAHITVLAEIAYMVHKLGLPLAQVLRMATSNPANLMQVSENIGKISVGQAANLVHINPTLSMATPL